MQTLHEGRRVWFSENVLEDQINPSVKMKPKARLLGGRLLGSVVRKENRKETRHQLQNSD